MVVYTIITAWLLVIFSWLAAYFLFKNKEGLENKSLAWFWLLVGLMWLLGGTRLIINKFGATHVGDIIPYLVQVLIPIHAAPLITLIISRLTKNMAITKFTTWLVIAFAASYLYYIFRDGLSPTIQTQYGPDNLLPESATFIFLMAFFVGLPLIIFDFIYSLGKAISNLSLASFYYFLPILSVLVYLSGGYLDKAKLELKYDWQILLTRLLYLIAVLLSYGYATAAGQKTLKAKKYG